mmetsp:Transcript_26316/g.42180  ORF Transcript_26316/g.42180 Transcript_26316/m.42180 type:complete len:433 (+) Transcript_26316:273-1571(+)|eukprot:CAMPEP_0171494598 /NCGR_PEP_ID=MMETSP0958-20121227/5646_1 /TAXON_ID=87120 /ORGANISM="Aurantiochytrium limacinum, Strain ATCCMYA-1381" /LENGTH=432 /DNA_ID=CAMNT_0012028429 /DNA_START=217 /DNA_END=1515 /DNA_ORIENTATION=-
MDMPSVYSKTLRHIEIYSLPSAVSKRIGTKTGLAMLGRSDPMLARHLPETFVWNPVTSEMTEAASKEEWDKFWAKVEAAGGKEKFVVKIDNTSRGRGVHIVSRREDLTPQLRYKLSQSGCVGQPYISRPCLMQGHKWDMRVYVMVTVAGASREPRAFRYHEGFARRCSNKYENESSAVDRRTHLTNTSVNNADGDRELLKYANSLMETLRDMDETQQALYPSLLMDEEELQEAMQKLALQEAAEAAEEAENGPSTEEKLPVTMTLTEAWQRLGSDYSANQLEKAEENIDELIRDVLRAAFRFIETSVTDPSRPTINYTYERHLMILGFDVLLDADLRPYLLEINRFPDMTCYTKDQLRIKQQLIRDTARLAFPDARTETLFDTVRNTQATCEFWEHANPSIAPTDPASPPRVPPLAQDRTNWTELDIDFKSL